jgi:Flp pilus assembly secretin CpaC
MRKTIGIGMGAALLAMAPVGLGQAQEAKPAEAEKAPGKRLQVRFQETRLRGETTTATRAYSLVLHADAGWASVFVGSQLTITMAAKETPTTNFKNAGVEGRVRAETLPDGRYRLDARFEEASVLGEGGVADARVTAGNPILRVVRGESRLTLREGETAPFASAADAVTGELVRIDLTVSAAPAAKAGPPTGRENGGLRAQLVLVRRQGETKVARRPYSVVLAAGEDAAEVFSGSMLPVQTMAQGGPTVALKDVGAGLKVSARRVADGRYRLGVEFSDGVLSRGKDSPQVRVFESDSQLFVQEGETVTVASVVDPETGEVVEAELTLEGVR